MGEVSLAESFETSVIVIVLTLILSFGAGALTYKILKPLTGWVLEPLENKESESD